MAEIYCFGDGKSAYMELKVESIPTISTALSRLPKDGSYTKEEYMNLARHASFREDIHKVRASTRSSQASSGSGTYWPGVGSG